MPGATAWLHADVANPQSSINRARVRAPEFPPGTWFNTGGPLTLAGLRGKLVLLDFWSSCCANCIHVIDELRPLEREFGDALVIIGVHSPKFEHERRDATVRDAADRYEIGHPVFNDPELYLWTQYAVRAWPTLVLIDAQGYVVAQAAGEGQVGALGLIIAELIGRHASDGSLRPEGSPYVAAAAQSGALRFPAKVVAAGDSLWIADAGHHRLVRTALDGVTVQQTVGSGTRGAGSGQFNEPNGLALLPPEVAGPAGFDLVVADTGNHVLRGVRSATGEIVRTIDLPAALDGQATVTGPIPAVLSPWDVAWWPAVGQVAVAAAGVHLLLGWNPSTDAVSILAGTTVEGLRDGAALDGWLAQPSGLAADGDRLWFADAETSALRWLSASGELNTAAGEGLFDFGYVDGPAPQARLQHPLGLAMLPDGSVAVADTYNGAIRRYDPATDQVSTLATDLAEPSGVLVLGAGDRPQDILVVESAAHRLVRPVGAGQLDLARGRAMSTRRPVTELANGQVHLSVSFTPPPGRKLDDRYGPPTRLTVSASPPELLASGGGDRAELARTLVLAGAPGQHGVLSVTAQAASCDDPTDGDTVAEHPACYLARQDWGVPIRITAEGSAAIELPLLG